MNRFCSLLALVALAVFSIMSTPDDASAHGRVGGIRFGGFRNIGFNSYTRNIGVGGCYGGGSANIFVPFRAVTSGYSYSANFAAPVAAYSGCSSYFSAPIVAYTPPAQVVYQQPIVVQQPSQVVYQQPAPIVSQQYTAPAVQYNTAPACGCNCPAHNAPTGGTTAPITPYVPPTGNIQTSYTAKRSATTSAPRVAKAGYAAFF